MILIGRFFSPDQISDVIITINLFYAVNKQDFEVQKWFVTHVEALHTQHLQRKPSLENLSNISLILRSV